MKNLFTVGVSEIHTPQILSYPSSDNGRTSSGEPPIHDNPLTSRSPAILMAGNVPLSKQSGSTEAHGGKHKCPTQDPGPCIAGPSWIHPLKFSGKHVPIFK
ncbi:hypothetical protein FXO38_23159 [Capsicum annuum]|nr:hypothetical protein FXO37_29337 [Capsicum annuum]KAF3638621.1 hypothetical protein FXO38_23159 [Capsicum annuum]